MAAVSGAFIGFFFNLIAFLGFALLDGVDWSLQMFLFIPLVIALYLLVMGLGLILSIIVVKIRDILSLWEVVTQLGFWFTPVMYPMSNVPENYRFYEFLNPMSGILEYSRYVLVGIGGMTKLGYCYVLGISFIMFLIGLAVFKCKEAEMVEDL